MTIKDDYLARVLIETYWNVKEKIRILADDHGSCINRNILECKVYLF